ncbi:Helix-turn-helix domain-containing protein [Gracilibacillus ureilyticus]|uniref:Helix-turn-helix domain-containing protein n=1 Tax=Gracilibacillus ureilyticus TaxID=531814 RepID=A0A1H9VXL5_9BACI|nr:response regulator [Gracilibacillus ureilyticus]SES26234.1 Helix-turn-helix domain-containing protein [Gracilibacillus ureilyticus]
MYKILVVDDEPLIRTGVKHMIVNHGNKLFSEIEEASDGIDALDIIENFQPHLLITDIQMPEMNGLELIHEAKKKNVNHFVILSGYDEFDYAQKAIRLQVDDYLLKPINQTRLSEILSQTVSRLENKERLLNYNHSLKEIKEPDEKESVRKFKTFVRENYMNDISLSEVAEYMNLHPNYVCNLLKKEIDTTFVHYVHETRIKHAKQLLIDECNLQLSAIATRVGYENSRHFYKKFKQFVGQTPGNYRSEMKRKGEQI